MGSIEYEIEEIVERWALSTQFWRILEVDAPAPAADLTRRLKEARSIAMSSPGYGLDEFDVAYSAGGAIDRGPPPWKIGFSKQFKKDTKALDRKLMGRIFEVISEVADYAPPFETKGDTFKPLSGELSGYWRYRIGDHRLLLEPQPRRATINLLSFGARGSVYE